MSDDALKMRSQRRRRTFVVVSLLIVVLATGFAWRAHRWIDERFVGAWRVTHNKGDSVEVYVLNRDGSGLRLSQSGSTWQRVLGFQHGWSISRDGFHFGTNPSGVSQLADYVLDLGGLRTAGQFRAFQYFGGIPGELVRVTPDRIVLRFSRAGILKPDELTLTRIRQEEIPPWR
jgi:hypothetical protein